MSTSLPKLTHRWFALTLIQKFAVISAIVLLTGSLVIGSWVSRKIEYGVTQNAAVTTALYMESFIAPVSQELAHSDQLSSQSRAAIERLFNETSLGERVISFKIWKRGGLIVNAADKTIIGKNFGETENLRKAFAGEVVAGFDDLGDEEDAAERARGIPLLEIYSPIREAFTGRTIAVAEFYERAEGLETALAAARRESWIVVGVVMGLTALLLFGIVAGGGRTIRRQQETLERRVRELADLADQNRRLRTRVESAAGRAAEMNEQYLRRFSADLHDGPAQMLALAALRLDGPDDGKTIGGLQTVRDAVKGALQEIRLLCQGLALPELEGLSLDEVIIAAVDGHRRRTQSHVDVISLALQVPLTHPQRICIYRFIQEGLNNAYRHAEGVGQRINTELDGRALRIGISDQGPGLSDAVLNGGATRLGLRGLKDRVESMGGTMVVDNLPDAGALLEMTLFVTEGDAA